MQSVPQDLLKEYVQSQHFTSTTEIMEAMKEMFRDVIQTVMEVEMDEELGRERCERSDAPEGTPRNYRNGYTKKTVKTQLGEVDIKVPRDRNGSFEPKIIGKYDRNADGMEDKILALYACGMSQRDIAEQIKELYGVEISPELVTKISEKIMPEVTAWQNRPLEPVYPFVFMDAIHYKVREDRRYVTKAAYVVLGVTMDGRKDILGVWIGEHENSKFWLNVLNDLKSRGVLDVYLFCTDGLCGMMQAIEAVFPKSRLQRCIVHQVRSSTRYVSYKDIKKVVADLKKIYSAVTLEEAEKNLQAIAETWRKQYPSCVKSWEENWPVLSTFFEYPVEIRKIIYTTNIIEGLNRQFRQITKNKPSRPSQILCKPPMWCRIEAPHRRFYIWPERIVLQKKTPGGRKSENCCRWQTSAAWMTFRACLRRQSQNSWRMAWKQSWMMNWATASMTTRTRTQITAATVTVIKHCGPASEM